MGTLSFVFCIYRTTVIIHILHDRKTIFIEKLLFLARRLNQKLISNPYLTEYIQTCRTSCQPDLIYGPALISFRWNVPPWPYILARPSIWHLRVSGNLDTMLHSCSCASFVICYCMLMEKMDENGSFMAITHFFHLRVGSLLASFRGSKVWPGGLLQAITPTRGILGFGASKC